VENAKTCIFPKFPEFGESQISENSLKGMTRGLAADLSAYHGLMHSKE